MPHIPKSVEVAPIEGLRLIHEGKVRQHYALPNYPDLRLSRTTRRVSAFNFVLPVFITDKDAILTALSTFWEDKLSFKSDTVAFGSNIDRILPQPLKGKPELWKTCTVIKCKTPDPYEGVVRANITGTAWKEYCRAGNGTLWGHQLPLGLKKWEELPQPIFTPTDKSETDDPIAIDAFRQTYGLNPEILCRSLFKQARSLAKKKGIIIVDTKFELSGLTVVDEKLTTDSSRFCGEDDLAAAIKEGREPVSLDKQAIRNVCIELGIDKLKPTIPAHLDLVAATKFPPEMAERTTDLLHHIFQRLTGFTLKGFCAIKMGIS